MKKNETIETKKANLEKELKRLEAFGAILKKAEEQLKWEFMETVRDENGEVVEDENGNYVFAAPDPDYWKYDDYIAMRDAIEEIRSII